jgi:hypothetical protein
MRLYWKAGQGDTESRCRIRTARSTGHTIGWPYIAKIVDRFGMAWTCTCTYLNELTRKRQFSEIPVVF